MPHSRCVIAATFASVSLLTTPARAQQDPWSARGRALLDTPLASFQGVNCVSIHAPRSIVWRLLVAPEYLEMFRLIAEEAARLTDPPLHEVPVAEAARTSHATRK
jgi:hypothetical protein